MIFIGPGNTYPKFVGDLLLENSEWDWSNGLPDGWILVTETEQPQPASGYRIVESNPAIIDGIAYQQWSMREISDLDRERLSVVEEEARNRRQL